METLLLTGFIVISVVGAFMGASMGLLKKWFLMVVGIVIAFTPIGVVLIKFSEVFRTWFIQQSFVGKTFIIIPYIAACLSAAFLPLTIKYKEVMGVFILGCTALVAITIFIVNP